MLIIVSAISPIRSGCTARRTGEERRREEGKEALTWAVRREEGDLDGGQREEVEGVCRGGRGPLGHL